MIERSNRHRETPRQQKKSDGDTGALEKSFFYCFSSIKLLVSKRAGLCA